MATKYVYLFANGKADGRGDMKGLLGGKGAGLAEMTNAGLPVPPGFTITTEACNEYFLTDQNSRNGTFIRIRGEIQLKPGDTFLVGKQVFRFGRK